MIVQFEAVSWSVLEYWRPHSEVPVPVMPIPGCMAVARKDGRIVGIGAVSSETHDGFPVLGPIYADSVRIMLKVVDALENLLMQAGHVAYHFCTSATGRLNVNAAARPSVCRRVGEDAQGVWYARQLDGQWR